MLQVNQLVGFGGDSGRLVPVVKSYDDQTHTDPPGASAREYTFTGQDLGSSGTKKVVVLVAFQTGASSGSVTLDDVLIDPGSGFVSLTKIIGVLSQTWTYRADIWTIETITAATGDVKLEFSANAELDIWVYSLVGAASAAYDTASDTQVDSAASGIMSASLNIPAGGAAIGLSTHSTGGVLGDTTTVWTGLTKDSDVPTNVDSGYPGAGIHVECSSASTISATAQTGLTISSDNNSGNINDPGGCNLALASWAPA